MIMLRSPFFVLLFLLAFSRSPVIADTSNDEEPVRKVIEGYYGAWNKHDPKKIAEYFAIDGDIRTPWNEIGKNRKEIEQIYANQYANVMKNASIKASIKSIRMVKPNIAFVDVESTILGMSTPDEKQYTPLHHHVVYVLTKKGDKWEILIGRPF